MLQHKGPLLGTHARILRDHFFICNFLGQFFKLNRIIAFANVRHFLSDQNVGNLGVLLARYVKTGGLSFVNLERLEVASGVVNFVVRLNLELGRSGHIFYSKLKI